MRTGAEYLQSLRDGRRVYVGGELIEDVTTHPMARRELPFCSRRRPSRIRRTALSPAIGPARLSAAVVPDRLPAEARMGARSLR